MKKLLKSKGFTLVELMVVIVIVGILAAVAIPKFLDASNKAKASEFPTTLSAIYTGQGAYQAQTGTYASSFQNMNDSAGVLVTSTSKWFGYDLGTPTSFSFTATATVSAVFGVVAANDIATVDQNNSKYAKGGLAQYCPSWK